VADRDLIRDVMKARIRSVQWEAPAVLSFVMEPLAGEHFPPFTAGSHIDVTLQSGLTRSYSLLNDPAEADRYEIGVQLDENTRGGSKHVHQVWRPGQVIEISAPSNNFALDESAAHSVLIAGGIGLTPMLSMLARLDRTGKTWELHYACRSRDRAAFLDRVGHRPEVRFYVDDEPAVGSLKLDAVLEAAPDGTHFYCCGPQGMLNAYRSLVEPIGERGHYEYFGADVATAVEGGYKLELARSKKTIAVPAGETMLDALLNAGLDVPFACGEGVCGTCRLAVLDGVPDHRDLFLSEAEKASNRCVMPCCSGSRSATLTLDI
jgi:ferredoxin-NADP reductase